LLVQAVEPATDVEKAGHATHVDASESAWNVPAGHGKIMPAVLVSPLKL
jgi:hypothetical protein